MSDSITCSVCQHEIEEQYCPNCGQKYKPGKITFWTTIGDLLTNLFSLEKSVAASSFKLLFRPDFIIHNYINGFKNYYPSPGKMLLVALTIAGLHLTFVDDVLLGLSFNIENMSVQIGFFLFFIPFSAAVSKLSHLRKTIGFIKHWITSIYLSAAYLILLTVITDILYWLSPLRMGAYMGLVFLLLILFGDARVHNQGNNKQIILHFFLEILVFIVFVGGIFYLNYLSDPESFQITY